MRDKSKALLGDLRFNLNIMINIEIMFKNLDLYLSLQMTILFTYMIYQICPKFLPA